jgi:hypothetical protein
MPPIATYSENRWLVTQRFELLPDRLTLTGSKLLSGGWQSTHFLRDLKATPTRGWLRATGFGLGMFVCGVGFGLSAYWLVSQGLQAGVHGPVVFGVLGVIGLVVALINARRIQFATFTAEAGVPVFSIRGSAREQGTYEAFLDAVIRHIQSAKGHA